MEENPEDNGNKPIKTKKIPDADDSAWIYEIINQKGEQCELKDSRGENCDTIAENKNELSIHKKHTHGIECDRCYVQVEKESDMKEHMRLYHSSKCLNCGFHPVDKFKDMYCRYCRSDIEKKYFNSQP